jgi:FPC/CPF motif-containing protein YcgG
MNIAVDTSAETARKIRADAHHHLKPNSGVPYWDKGELGSLQAGRLPQWALNGLTSFRRVVLDQRFPCTFATTAELNGQLVYAFAETATEKGDVMHIGDTIVAYLKSLADLPPDKVDFQVLVVLIKPMMDFQLQKYGVAAQTLLQSLHECDPAPWPAEIPTDENDPLWSFAFAGRGLFINFSTPANHARLSRNVGACMTLIISPRDVFDRVAGPTDKGRRVRNLIRERTKDYDDGLPFAPWSSFAYGEGTVGTERSQYVLSDDNETPISLSLKQCPFHAKT